MHEHAHWLTQYGYPGLVVLLAAGIVGLPVPDETLLTVAGYLAFRGKLTLPGVLAAGFLGAVVGISLSYWIGRTAGHRAVVRFGARLHLSAERLARAERWFERAGLWVLFAGYFVPGFRHFTALAAGTAELPWRRFALGAYPGALVWSAAFVLLGYFAGRDWRPIWEAVQEERLLVVAAAVILLLLVWLRRRRRAKRSTGTDGSG